jgi:hypothetical protein
MHTFVDNVARHGNLYMSDNFAQPDNFIDDGPGVAGVITSVAIPMRQIQLGLKYNF